MGIKLEIELEALTKPAVARALSQLLLALGDDSPVAAEQPVAAPAPAAAPPEAAPAPGAPATPRPARKASPSAARPAPARPAAAATPARPAPKSTPNGDEDHSVHERYQSFFEQLPERSRRFLDLVREKGTLTIDEAMQALGIKVPKAMGGITGSIGRWAPVRRVPIPYEAIETSDGRRAWRWIGIGDGERTPTKPPRASKPASSPPAAKSPAAKPATAKGPARPPADGNGFDSFLADLPSRSRQFVQLLRDRGRLTISEVREEFKLARAKAVGGIIEPVKRIALDHGLWPVYDSETTEDGERVWIWLSPAAK